MDPTVINQGKTIFHFLLFSTRENEKINDDREIMIATTWFSFYSLFSYNTIMGQRRRTKISREKMVEHVTQKSNNRKSQFPLNFPHQLFM